VALLVMKVNDSLVLVPTARYAVLTDCATQQDPLIRRPNPCPHSLLDAPEGPLSPLPLRRHSLL
jgi:hypothetical protein